MNPSSTTVALLFRDNYIYTNNNAITTSMQLISIEKYKKLDAAKTQLVEFDLSKDM